jgi:hypothetical protein
VTSVLSPSLRSGRRLAGSRALYALLRRLRCSRRRYARAHAHKPRTNHFPTPPRIRHKLVGWPDSRRDEMEREAQRSSASVASGTKHQSCARRRNRPTGPPVATPMASANIRTIRRGRFGFFFSMEAEPSATSAHASRRTPDGIRGPFLPRHARARTPDGIRGPFFAAPPPHANALIRSFHNRFEGGAGWPP